MTEHTPGLWHFNRHCGGQYYGDLTSDLGMRDGLRYIRTIAVVLKYAGKEECEANARLMAAAPDLLLIAKRVAVYFEGLEGDLGNAALAAIEKATGEKTATDADCPYRSPR